MNFRIYALSIVSTLIVVLGGCSVADPGKTLNPASGIPDATTPPDTAPVTPVLVSEPMPVVSAPVENSPEATPAPAPAVTPTPPPAPAEATAPEMTPSPYVASEPTTAPSSETSAEPAPVTMTPPEEMPEPLATIEETPTTPAANIIDVTEIVKVSEPVSTPAVVSNEMDSSTTNNDSYSPPVTNVTDNQSEPNSGSPTVAPTEPAVQTPVPAAIMEVVEISNPAPEYGTDPSMPEQTPVVAAPAQQPTPTPMPAPIQAITPSPAPAPVVAAPAPAPVVAGPTPSSTYDDEDEDNNQSPNYGNSGKDESNDDTEFTVSGSCLGKKNAGVVWYDNRDKNKKKNTSVHCKNNKFEIKIKDKKKNLPYLEIQTLFFD